MIGGGWNWHGGGGWLVVVEGSWCRRSGGDDWLCIAGVTGVGTVEVMIGSI